MRCCVLNKPNVLHPDPACPVYLYLNIHQFQFRTIFPPEFPWILRMELAGQMRHEGRSSTNLNIKESVIKADSSDWFFNLRSAAWVFAVCIPGQLTVDPRLLLSLLLLVAPAASTILQPSHSTHFNLNEKNQEVTPWHSKGCSFTNRQSAGDEKNK